MTGWQGWSPRGCREPRDLPRRETGTQYETRPEIPVTQYRVSAVSLRPALTSSPSGPNIPAMDTAIRPALTGSGNSIVSPYSPEGQLPGQKEGGELGVVGEGKPNKTGSPGDAV